MFKNKILLIILMECYDYYLKNLNSEIMIQKFKDSINSLINNEQ